MSFARFDRFLLTSAERVVEPVGEVVDLDGELGQGAGQGLLDPAGLGGGVCCLALCGLACLEVGGSEGDQLVESFAELVVGDPGGLGFGCACLGRARQEPRRRL